MTPVDTHAVSVLRLIAKHPALYGQTPEDVNGLVLGVASMLIMLHSDQKQLDFREAYKIMDRVLNDDINVKHRRSRLGDEAASTSRLSSMDAFTANCGKFIDELEIVLGELDASHKNESAESA